MKEAHAGAPAPTRPAVVLLPSLPKPEKLNEEGTCVVPKMIQPSRFVLFFKAQLFRNFIFKDSSVRVEK